MPKATPKPMLRKERKIPYLTLFFPVTATAGTYGIYKLDAEGFRPIRFFGPSTIQVIAERE